MKQPTPEEDIAEFRAAVAGIRRLVPKHQQPGDGKPLSTRPRQTEADEQAVMAELLAEPELELLETGDTLSYRVAGVQDGVMCKLKRGQYRIGAELDLHGLNRDKAQLAVARFLAQCRDQRAHCVRIIHGKGNGSPNSGPVLKTYLNAWLRRRKDVVAFSSARPADGGTGAVYVLLRKTTT